MIYDPDLTDEGWMTVIPGLLMKEEPEPGPEIPPPCWDERKIDPDRCWAATKAMCG